MEKSDLIKDYLVSRIITQGRREPKGYGKIYYKTNENLVDSILDIDFYQKNVLSVLSSGDHVLTSRFLEASNVEAFDINRLTIYYFYLRLWTLKYLREIYPPVKKRSTRWLENLLDRVEPSNEQEYNAWKFFKQHAYEKTDLRELFYIIDIQRDGATLYSDADELEYSLDPSLTFYNYDLFKPVEAKKQYDIILISNILDWAENDPKKLAIARDNLTRLLKDDGVVLCSSLIRENNYDIEKEKQIFADSLTFNGNYSSYTYTRKK